MTESDIFGFLLNFASDDLEVTSRKTILDHCDRICMTLHNSKDFTFGLCTEPSILWHVPKLLRMMAK